MIAFL
jgi:hypothetical protein